MGAIGVDVLLPSTRASYPSFLSFFPCLSHSFILPFAVSAFNQMNAIFLLCVSTLLIYILE